MSKYVDLQIECQRMWNKRVQAIPVIIGATGVIDKNTKKYIGKIPGHHNIYMLQRLAILGTGHIMRKVLSIKTESVTGHNIQTMQVKGVGITPDENMVEATNLKSRDKTPLIIVIIITIIKIIIRHRNGDSVIIVFITN